MKTLAEATYKKAEKADFDWKLPQIEGDQVIDAGIDGKGEKMDL
ncbi:MAG: hypothetical protein P4M11_10805 [Candidatus Pacebacteria bacterium]|nr:hypothetical protein [Candidatus Paceibacterota bacterium]